AHGYLVGAARHGGDRAGQLHRLLDMGGLPERLLLRRSVPVPVLLAVRLGVLPAFDLRLRDSRLPLPHHRRALARLPHPVGPPPLPSHLLLLSEGVLPLLLAGPRRLRRARYQEALHGRDALSPDSSERPPLHLVRGCLLHRDAHVGCPSRLPVSHPHRTPP